MDWSTYDGRYFTSTFNFERQSYQRTSENYFERSNNNKNLSFFLSPPYADLTTNRLSGMSTGQTNRNIRKTKKKRMKILWVHKNRETPIIKLDSDETATASNKTISISKDKLKKPLLDLFRLLIASFRHIFFGIQNYTTAKRGRHMSILQNYKNETETGIFFGKRQEVVQNT